MFSSSFGKPQPCDVDPQSTFYPGTESTGTAGSILSHSYTKEEVRALLDEWSQLPDYEHFTILCFNKSVLLKTSFFTMDRETIERSRFLPSPFRRDLLMAMVENDAEKLSCLVEEEEEEK